MTLDDPTSLRLPRRRLLAGLIGAWSFGAFAQSPTPPTGERAGAAPRPTPWTALIEPGWDPARYFRSLDAEAVRDLSDDDPRARALFANLLRAGRDAPPATEMAGRSVNLIGFARPLSAGRADGVERLVFVPYQGECIHRPPPPANQAVLVHSASPLPEADLPYRLWLHGTLELNAAFTPLGATAWRVRGGRISRFDEDRHRHLLKPYPLL